MPQNKPKKSKRVVIKEELVELTGDWLSALILNQMMYWSERVYDVNNYLKEENDRRIKNNLKELDNDIESLKSGWIYKKAEDLIKELMIDFSRNTIHRKMNILLKNEYILRRKNPKYKWDKTYQYRINNLKIQEDLFKLGYSINGEALTNVPSEPTKDQEALMKDYNEPAIPEITIKTTKEITSKIFVPKAEDSGIDTTLENSCKDEINLENTNITQKFISVQKLDFDQKYLEYYEFLKQMTRIELASGHLVKYKEKWIAKAYLEMREEYGVDLLVQGIINLKKQYDNKIFSFFTKRLLVQFITKNKKAEVNITEGNIHYKCMCNYEIDLDKEDVCPKCSRTVDFNLIDKATLKKNCA
jgi:hypothetical protein